MYAKRKKKIMQKENCKAVGRNLLFCSVLGPAVARAKTAGHLFVVVWGREQTSDYSFSAAVIAVSVLV